ncbi:hypothetical protein Cs7R123_42740 [Catellatospora sp. TT07R-123]|uniref:hypothetical protein n=1 Tax=Catellatospora sp. TT07R-123 TaxID=2733863 RepID=UPI001B0FAA98|nr:hypothetical protein [Catellatospora sp. TT07R-123]GHJ46932.1 hypothetical protein Cs7R123_42740 [Catellatospora sp. TT07R-123]
MAQQLRVQDQVLVGASNRLQAAAMTVERARIALVAGVDRLDGCWGENDEVAQQFVSEYAPGRDAVLEGAVQVSTLLRTLGERVGRTANTFVTLEQDNTAGVQALQRRIAEQPAVPAD